MTYTLKERAQAQELIDLGYRITSNKHRIVSRIDRPDWREAMADYQTGGFPGDKAKNREQGMQWVNGLRDGAADFYRRVLTKDKKTVTHAVAAIMKTILRKQGAAYGWGACNEYIEAPKLQIIDVSGD